MRSSPYSITFDTTRSRPGIPASASVAATSCGCWNRDASSPGKVFSCLRFFASAIGRDSTARARHHINRRIPADGVKLDVCDST